MSHLQVDQFFLSKINYSISNNIVIVTYEISYILCGLFCKEKSYQPEAGS